MNIVTLLFYPLLCVCMLPMIVALTNHEERVGFFRCYFFTVLIAFVWIFIFGRQETIPYNHTEWYQVFSYYFLLDYQGLLGIVICAAVAILLNLKGQKMPAWLRVVAILLGVNTVFSVSQMLRTEIPNNIFELLTPLAANILIGGLIILSVSLVKEKKQWWIIGVLGITVCFYNGLFNSLLFFYKPVHCLSVFIVALIMFLAVFLEKKKIIKL
ncbi:MAG: hypothetical protein II258_05140 [Spirochaetales bacterium]|nr:hypothetical protein [Spirochaetales bacterium]